ncbi:hypothetical protein [Nocardioides terrisoli]|uniref:hypothetical protein n=1 Tax=Nocardioides terrisoli TaxID=3388267 RepID=UPI00287BC5FC|nr:hypothetical protein [Nocardioides marmorisolisilvae]
MFWIVVLALVVTAFGVAWWSSGRAPGRRDQISPADDKRHNDAYLEHGRNDVSGKLPPS